MDSEKPEEKTDEEIRRETLDRFGHIIGKKVKFAMKDDKLENYIIHAGEEITEEILFKAKAMDKLIALSLNIVESDSESKPNRDARQRILIGKKAARTVRADNGTIIVEAGAIITDEVLQRAKMSGKMIALSMSVK